MKEFYYTVKNPIGMHARPATQLVNTVKGLASVVTVEKQGKKSRCKETSGTYEPCSSTW